MVWRVVVAWCSVVARKMSGCTEAMVSPVRLGPIATPSGTANEVIYVQPSRATTSLPFAVLVFFGGDVQDYPEVMAAHRDHKRFVDWSLTNTATLLASKFPAHHVLVVKPSRMEKKTFSCYDNFVSSNSVGTPHHDPGIRALSHLTSLIPQALRKAFAAIDEELSADQSCAKSSISDSSPSPCRNNGFEWQSKDAQLCRGNTHEKSHQWLKKHFQLADVDQITLVGFSKGCVVLNQIITELHSVMSAEPLQSKLLLSFIDKVHNLYWLDGGHSGGHNTWITAPSVLKSLAAQQHIRIHIHVTPYQVRDEFSPWIGKECKAFYDTLQRAGAKVSYNLHFKEDPPSLLLHFKILKRFS